VSHDWGTAPDFVGPRHALRERLLLDVLLRGDPGRQVLNAGAGQGTFTRLLEHRGFEVTSTDASPAAVAVLEQRLEGPVAQADVTALPFADASFDAATIGFGIRNVSDLELGLRELRRVLRPGGRLAILEITRPRGPLRPFFSLWFDRIVPAVGGLLPGGSAYSYLPASVRRFPAAEELASLVAGAGFTDVGFRLLAGSIVALHSGTAVAESAA
jgi:ubiquinone/menaquinone biosynthesis methyltransferase